MEPADIKAVLMSEFSAMRSEITTFITLEVQFLSISVALAGVLVGFAVHDWNSFRESLDICPLPFLVFGLFYADTKARVLRAASYIQFKLRPQLVKAGLSESLLWEEYIRNEYQPGRYLAVIEWVRWSAFLAPAGVFLILSFNTPPNAGSMSRTFYPFLLFMDLVLIFFVLWMLFSLSQQDKELWKPLKKAD